LRLSAIWRFLRFNLPCFVRAPTICGKSTNCYNKFVSTIYSATANQAMPIVPTSLSSQAEYAWEVATLFPVQGRWSEDAYLDLTDGTNRRIELVDGRLEFLPMPTELHQALVAFLYQALLSFVTRYDLGVVPYAPLRVSISKERYREPDVMFLRKEHFHLRSNRIWKGADLLMEIVSGDPKDRKRDYEDKLTDYAAANVAEYWIVDPKQESVIVHQLTNDSYTVHGEFVTGQQATSPLLPGFVVDVTTLFAVKNDVAD
jgi:Uma2 family endonuclease